MQFDAPPHHENSKSLAYNPCSSQHFGGVILGVFPGGGLKLIGGVVDPEENVIIPLGSILTLESTDFDL